MREGDIVTIYENTYTRNKAEGKAQLIEKIALNSEPGLECWLVHFEGDEPGRNYERYIVPPELFEATPVRE